MNLENENVANLKRRLTFLRTIDQKLEGIRRENERLQRIAANPRVVFSRSSMAGLYRIVNSLVSAGPMYGLPEIEKWAVTSRDWLVALGRRGTGPSEEELERLMTAAGELGRLRDEAMSEVEQLLKGTSATAEPEPDTAPPKKESETKETSQIAEEKEAAASNTDPKAEEAEGFPFTDEPQNRTIKESEFAPKREKKDRSLRPSAKQGRFRDRTSTIPLAIDDLNMVGTVSKIPAKPEEKSSPGLFWKVFAVLSFAGFVVMTALYVNEKRGSTTSPNDVSSETPAVSEPITPPPAPVDTASDTTASDTSEPSTDAANDTSSSEKDEAERSDAKAKGKKSDRTDKERDDAKETRRSRSKTKDRDRKADSKSEKSAAADPASAQGILFVKAPADGSDVFVLVDGVSKGRAPIRTKLPPGLHEVVFTAEGKRSMRMVPIKADETKTVVATPPN